MANANAPSPQAQLEGLLAEEAAVQAELSRTPLFETAQRAELNNQLGRLSAIIARHCARHGLARPT